MLFREDEKYRMEANEDMLYEMALTMVNTIQEKRYLEKENARLQKIVDDYDQKLRNDLKEGNKFIGEMLTTLVNKAVE